MSFVQQLQGSMPSPQLLPPAIGTPRRRVASAWGNDDEPPPPLFLLDDADPDAEGEQQGAELETKRGANPNGPSRSNAGNSAPLTATAATPARRASAARVRLMLAVMLCGHCRLQLASAWRRWAARCAAVRLQSALGAMAAHSSEERRRMLSVIAAVRSAPQSRR